MESILIKIVMEIINLPLRFLSWPVLWLFKKIYPLKKLESEIFIHLGDDKPVSFQISTQIPTVIITARVINATLMDVVLEKLCIENLHVGGVTILNGSCFNENGNIDRGVEKIFFQQFELNEYKVKELQRIKDERVGTTTSLTLYISACFDVKPYGKFKKFYPITTSCNIN